MFVCFFTGEGENIQVVFAQLPQPPLPLVIEREENDDGIEDIDNEFLDDDLFETDLFVNDDDTENDLFVW